MTGIELSAATLIYTQEADCCSDQITQQLQIEIRDGGGGPYYVLKTREWAVDDPQDLMSILAAVITLCSQEPPCPTPCD